jgi:hypothetical protein
VYGITIPNVEFYLFSMLKRDAGPGVHGGPELFSKRPNPVLMPDTGDLPSINATLSNYLDPSAFFQPP